MIMRSVPLRSFVAMLVSVVAGACADRSGIRHVEDLERGSLLSGGRQRTFRYREPPSVPGGLRPLVIALHARSRDGAAMEELSGFSPIAAREGLVLAFPDGLQGSWAAPKEEGDDVAFLSELISLFVAQHRADPSRVYLVGMSNGGFMTLTAACALSNKVTAAVSVAASMSAVLAGSCHPTRPMSVALLLGEADHIVPYGGGEIMGGRGAVLSGPDSAKFWVATNGCSGNPTIEPIPDDDPTDGTKSLRSHWTSCRGGTEVELVTVRDGGHTWPGGHWFFGEWFFGRKSRDFSAGELAWEFLRRFSL
jgi:polyhydroxybutyrate depolymerase